MAAKMIGSILSFLINIAFAIVMFFMMLVMMNGFSGSDAEPGLIAYAVLSFLISVVMAGATWLFVRYLLGRPVQGWIAGLIAVPIFCVVGGVLIVIASVIGVGIAEYKRTSRVPARSAAHLTPPPADRYADR